MKAIRARAILGCVVAIQKGVPIKFLKEEMIEALKDKAKTLTKKDIRFKRFEVNEKDLEYKEK